LKEAVARYTDALASWEEALREEPHPKTFAKGDRVRYDAARKVGFATVESAFTVMDEYFLRDLGTDQAIWVGDAGGDLQRFSRSELRTVPQDLFDLRFACAQNLAAVRLKQDDFSEAIRWADEALKMNGKAPKALMRKGSALLKSGQPGPASDVLAAAAAEVPKDAEVRKLLREAEKTRPGNWVCMNGCCGPGFSVCGNTSLTTSSNLSKVSAGATLQLGPKVTQNAAIDDSKSDSDCSTCSGNDDQECSKQTTSQQESADASDQSLEPTSNTADEEYSERAAADEQVAASTVVVESAESAVVASSEADAPGSAAATVVESAAANQDQALASEATSKPAPASTTEAASAEGCEKAKEPSRISQLQCVLTASVLALAMAAGLLLGRSGGPPQVLGV